MVGWDDAKLQSEAAAERLSRQHRYRAALREDAAVAAPEVAAMVGIDRPQRMLWHDQPYQMHMLVQLHHRGMAGDRVAALVLEMETCEEGLNGLDVPGVGIDLGCYRAVRSHVR
jgi:hypothetical protein